MIHLHKTCWTFSSYMNFIKNWSFFSFFSFFFPYVWLVNIILSSCKYNTSRVLLLSLKDLKFHSLESLFRLNLMLFNKSLVSVTEQRLMKIDPTKMIENEIQWLLNFECGTNLGKVMAYKIFWKIFFVSLELHSSGFSLYCLVYSEGYILAIDPELSIKQLV